MCASFYFHEGSDMQNKLFQLQSLEEKQHKLMVVLERKTNRMLSKFQTQQILNEVNVHRQYRVRVHQEPETFLDALFLCRDQGNRDTGKIAFGNLKFGVIRDTMISNPVFVQKRLPAAVVMTRCRTEGTRQVYTNLIHIYLPRYEMRNLL